MALASILTMNAGNSYAGRGPDRRSDGRRSEGRYVESFSYRRHHPYFGREVFFPELLARLIVRAKVEYYYHHGYFYRRGPSGYVIVDAPVGVVVTDLPSDRKIIIMGGSTYYYCNDVYYRNSRAGYVVVPDPVYQVVELPKEVQVLDVQKQKMTVNAADSQDSFTVNIPNSQGGFTAVLIKKIKDGFIGPQGEFYAEFPSVEQLKVMYGQL